MGYSLPGSSVHGVSQARILKWVAISFSRSFQPRSPTHLSCVSCTGGFFTTVATWEALCVPELVIYVALCLSVPICKMRLAVGLPPPNEDAVGLEWTHADSPEHWLLQ